MKRAAAVGCVLLFLALGARFVPLAGIGHDEALHAQTAALWLEPGKIENYWRWLPWMQSPYMGTLKAFVLYASFWVFGIGPEALRWTTLAIGAAGLLGFYLLTLALFGPALAVAAGLLMASDPAWVLGAAFDTGPAVLSASLKIWGLWCLLRWWRRESGTGSLFAAGVLFGLGLWDKAHFGWFLAALALGAALYRRELRTRVDRRALASGLGGLALGAAPLLLMNLLHPGFTLLDRAHMGWSAAAHAGGLPALTAERLASLRETLDGSFMDSFVSGIDSAPGEFGRALALQLLLAPLLLAAALWRDAKWKSLRPAAFWTALSAGVFALACLSPLPVKGHHLYALYPFPLLAFLSLWPAVFTVLKKQEARWTVAVPSFLLLFGLNLASVRTSAAHLARSGGAPQFHVGLREVAAWADAFVQNHPGVQVYAGSLEKPLLVHVNGRWSPRQVNFFEDDYEFLGDADALVVQHLPPFCEVAETPWKVHALARSAGVSVSTAAVFHYSDGRPWVAAYRFQRPGGRRPETEALKTQGVALFRSGDAAGAEAVFSEALAIEPLSAELHLDRGVALIELGRRADARRALQRAVSLSKGAVLRHDQDIARAARESLASLEAKR